MKTWILFICVVALMAPKISRAADEVDDWFRRRIAADVEERSIERRDYCQDQDPMRCIIRQRLCDFSNWFSSQYWKFISFTVYECPHTCRAC